MEGLIWFSSASWFPSDRHNFLRLARQPAKPISIDTASSAPIQWISVLPAGELTAKSYDDLAKTKIWPKPSQPFHIGTSSLAHTVVPCRRPDRSRGEAFLEGVDHPAYVGEAVVQRHRSEAHHIGLASISDDAFFSERLL